MTELSMQQKREWAKTLYLKENLTQQEIAERVGVSRITVNNWIARTDGRCSRHPSPSHARNN